MEKLTDEDFAMLDELLKDFKAENPETPKKPKSPSINPSPIINPKPIVLKISDYKNLVKLFDLSVVNDYINKGSEINSYLRGENPKPYLKGFIPGIDKQFLKLGDVLKKAGIPFQSKDYLEVYRYMTHQYNEEKTQGYISTSNKKLAGFGGNCYKILIPLEAKVIFADISSSTSQLNSFEIILPRATRLYDTTYKEENDCEVYEVL